MGVGGRTGLVGSVTRGGVWVATVVAKMRAVAPGTNNWEGVVGTRFGRYSRGISGWTTNPFPLEIKEEKGRLAATRGLRAWPSGKPLG